MEYFDTVTLKNGVRCCLRSAAKEDGKAVLDNFIAVRGQSDFLLSYQDEITFTAESEGNFLSSKLESENEVLLVAVIDNKVVGTAGIDAIGGAYKVRHRAEFGVSVDSGFWGLGIGRALTEACIQCAKKAGYSQLELSVVAENKGAVSLYKKMGFTEYGRNPKGFLSRISGFQELIHMRLEL